MEYIAPLILNDTGRGLQDLSKILKVEINVLKDFTKGIPETYNYVTFFIPKKSGKKRQIDAPNDKLKDLQLSIYKRLLKKEGFQTAATGFIPKRSIIDNALPHIKSRIVINIDLKDFFFSIKENTIYKYWLGSGWNEEASVILTNICCKDGSLPQGSPTSPALSNVVNRLFDGLILDIAKKYGARYTRYADDLTISFPNKGGKSENKAKSLISEIKERINSDNYKIQYQKGIKVLRPHQRQLVTGLVVNDDINLPRQTRKLIRALQHKRDLGILSELDVKRLEGYESLQRMVEVSKSKNTKVKKDEEKNTNQGRITIMTNGGDIVFGDKNTAGDNIGGIQNIGKFQNVVSNLNKGGHKELADALVKLNEAIINSNLSDKDKESHTDALKQIGEESAKEKPNKTMMKYMWEGLTTTLSAIPDIAKIVGTVAPFITPYFS